MVSVAFSMKPPGGDQPASAVEPVARITIRNERMCLVRGHLFDREGMVISGSSDLAGAKSRLPPAPLRSGCVWEMRGNEQRACLILSS